MRASEYEQRVELTDASTLFAPAVATCVMQSQAVVCSLLPEEAEAVVGATEQRQREFALGRQCARRALGALGAPTTALQRSSNGIPLWPSGFTGSISHCASLCCAAAAPVGEILALGIDVELAEPFEENLIRLVCRPEELSRLGTMHAAQGFDWPNVVLSAKEAIYKCLFPRFGRFLEFHDVSLELSVDEAGKNGAFLLAWLSPEATNSFDPGRLSGRWLVNKGCVLAGVTAYQRTLTRYVSVPSDP